MFKSNVLFDRRAFVGGVLSLAILGFLFTAIPMVSAHSDPGGCTSTAVGIAITIYESDGTTPKAGNAQSGETLKYEAELSYVTAGGNKCNFEGGTLAIVTPDGVSHDVTPGGGIPLVSSGFPFTSGQISYVVSEADAIGDNDLDVIVNYTSGTSHKGEGHNTISGSANDNTPFEDVSLEVTKTAIEASEVEYEWTIDKSVTPSTWDLFNGDSGTSEYTITLTKSTGTANHSVSGTITVHNPALFADAEVTSVSDSIFGVGAATVDCTGDLSFTSFPHILGPGEDLICTYSSALPDSTTRTNTATADTSGDVNGDSGDASVDFTGVVPTEVNGTVNVDDTNNVGDNGPFSASDSYTYTRTFSCDADEGQNDNTADVIGDGDVVLDSDSASVTVNCYDLEVTKDADESLDRQYHWMIEKVGDQTELILAPGEVFPVNYDVTVDVTGSTDSNWVVEGIITIHNPAPIDAIINSVSDIVTNNGAATVDCGLAVFPYTLLTGGADLVCTYSKSLPDGDSETNTATAELQNNNYDEDLIATPDGTTDFSGDASVNFDGAIVNEIDECIDVSDPLGGGPLGTVCADNAPETFEYSHDVGPYTDQDCGVPQTVDNTASFVTTDDDNDTDEDGSDDHSVDVTVACTCTLTQGYWKTHSEKGPAPFDVNWNNLPGGSAEDTVFFGSEKTWYEVFWTPVAGKPYYQLAHQYMAAKLNVLSGAAPTPAVTQALLDAEALFINPLYNTPAEIDALKGKNANAVRQQFTSLAGILGSFNEGLIGPGHCDEQIPD